MKKIALFGFFVGSLMLLACSLNNLIAEAIRKEIPEIPQVESREKKYVYGYDEIASIFGCCKSQAYHIKKSGVIDKAITQFGKKITIDADLALKLVQENNKKKGRRL